MLAATGIAFGPLCLLTTDPADTIADFCATLEAPPFNTGPLVAKPPADVADDNGTLLGNPDAVAAGAVAAAFPVPIILLLLPVFASG